MRELATLAIALFGVGLIAAPTGAQAIVELDLVMRDRGSPTAAQRWSQVLGEAGFSRPTIRSARASDEFGIANEGSERRPIYQVTGYLLANDTILLPPRARFGLRDGGRLAKWVRDLKDNGIETATSGTTAFGLSPQRLEQVTNELKQVVRASTVGDSAPDTVATLGEALRLPLTVDATARRALIADDPIRDELQGLATGTALAAILRPAGLVLRPQSRSGRIELLVVDARNRGDNWPIGWATDTTPGRLVPGLFEREETQAVEVPLAAALAELSARVKAPFLLDHNSLALRRIDPNKTNIMMRAGRTHYGNILNQVLGQVDLGYEVRVDENEKPFLWITTVR